jgi:phage regulator Rha-like protein
MSANFDTVTLARLPLLPSITSRELADQMGMEHKSVMRIIDKVVIENPSYVDGARVAPSTYKNKQNKTQPQYRVTEVGLLLLAPKLGMHDKVVELFLVRFKKTLEHNFQLIQKQNYLMLEENSKLKAKLKKRDNPESGETIPNYTTDENGKTTKEILYMRNISRIERLDAMLSNCRVQEIGRAKQVAKLELIKRDTEKGVIEPCKYYGLKSVYSPYLDEDCRD